VNFFEEITQPDEDTWGWGLPNAETVERPVEGNMPRSGHPVFCSASGARPRDTTKDDC
jgi:hypothetical protein